MIICFFRKDHAKIGQPDTGEECQDEETSLGCMSLMSTGSIVEIWALHPQVFMAFTIQPSISNIL